MEDSRLKIAKCRFLTPTPLFLATYIIIYKNISLKKLKKKIEKNVKSISLNHIHSRKIL